MTTFALDTRELQILCALPTLQALPRAATFLGASTVLPGDGGIHSVGNPYGEVAVSVHLYGPRMGNVDGRDYDPSRDYVCDRLDDETDEFGGSADTRRRKELRR